MKTPWSKPTITRLAITGDITKEITMKRILLVSLATLMFAAPALVFYANGARVKIANLTLKQGLGTLSVRPAGIAVKPPQ